MMLDRGFPPLEHRLIGAFRVDLSNKSADELRTMLDNAERAGAMPKATAQRVAAAEAMRDAAQAELALRGTAVRARGAVREASPSAALAAAASERIVAAAGRAKVRFDLSPEKANTKSAHALLAKDGSPKIGGRVRSKAVKRNPYISYRNGDRIAVLGFVVPKDEEGEGFWEGGLLKPGELDAAPGAYVGPDAEAAEAAFIALLEEIAPPRQEG